MVDGCRGDEGRVEFPEGRGLLLGIAGMVERREPVRYSGSCDEQGRTDTQIRDGQFQWNRGPSGVPKGPVYCYGWRRVVAAVLADQRLDDTGEER